ncbi:MAG: hypothetical protein ABR968_11930 [Bacteroidales bacterium]|jgi:hypothetical protein
MKNTIFALVIIIMTVTMLTNCQLTNNKLEAQKKVQDAKEAEVKVSRELNLAFKDSIQRIRKEFEGKANIYEMKLANCRNIIAYNKKETKIINEKKEADLEQKNIDMENRLYNYKDTDEGKDSWELFRYEFSRDMDELGKSIKGING